MCWRLLYVADFVFLRAVRLRTQRAAVASRRATTLAIHLPILATHLPNILHFSVTTLANFLMLSKKTPILMPIRIRLFILMPIQVQIRILPSFKSDFFFTFIHCSTSSSHCLLFFLQCHRVTGVKIFIFRKVVRCTEILSKKVRVYTDSSSALD